MSQDATRLDTALYGATSEFQGADHRRSIWQLANSTLPYFALLAVMYWSLGVSYWITLALAVPAAGFLIRVFIIFHDCGHGSFFRSRNANRAVGFLTGAMVFMPFYYWTHQHSIHHATAGNLDKRGSGDITTITVEEYRERSWLGRLMYRLYRSPPAILFFGPMFVFFFRYRYWRPGDSIRRAYSAMRTNIALAVIILAAVFTIGIKAYLMIQLPIMVVAGATGIWLFYVQHQFPEAYWKRNKQWEHLRGAIEGSSFYKLPRVLQWFTGNIGFHHVHHVNPRIPNYRLQACHEAIAEFREVVPIHFFESFRLLNCQLWDEERGRLISFGEIRG